VGVTYEGMPRARSEVRNVWSENMAVWRTAFTGVDGFRDGFGKVGSHSRPEDTEFCIRVADATGRPWLFVPDAGITHDVPANRATWRFFVRRCYDEGLGKAEMAALSSGPTLGDERGHVLGTIPRGVLRDLRAALSGDLWAPARIGSTVVGLGAAACGYAGGLLAAWRARH
jgi:hypothetical protein